MLIEREQKGRNGCYGWKVMRQIILPLTFLFCCLNAKANAATRCAVRPLVYHASSNYILPQSLLVNPRATSSGCFTAVQMLWRKLSALAKIQSNLDAYLVIKGNVFASNALKADDVKGAKSFWSDVIEDYTLMQRAEGANDIPNPIASRELLARDYGTAFKLYDPLVHDGSISVYLTNYKSFPLASTSFFAGIKAARNGRYRLAENTFRRLTRARLPLSHDNPESWFFLGAVQLAEGRTREARDSFLACSNRHNDVGAMQQPNVIWTARASYILDNLY